MTQLSFRASVQGMLRERLLDSARDIVVADDWAAVTMAKVAERAGVSRQTVYNEFGAKPDLADALVMRELGSFLEVVRSSFAGEDDLVDGLRAAASGALALAAANPLLKAVLDSAHYGESELLPLLTTESQNLIDTTTAFLRDAIQERYGDTGIASDRLDFAVDAIVRLVLSHVMRPSASPEQTADGIAWIAQHLVAPR